MASDFPIFEKEIESGIDALSKNPAVDPKRIGMIGFSLGAHLSLAVGAQQPTKVAAIVDCYGELFPEFEAPGGLTSASSSQIDYRNLDRWRLIACAGSLSEPPKADIACTSVNLLTLVTPVDDRS